MKWIFVALGLAGLGAAASFVAGNRAGRNSLLILNVLSLWYLVVGTVTAITQILLLAFGNKKSRGQV